MNGPHAASGSAGGGGAPRTLLFSTSLCGVATDVSYSLYADQLLLIITQLGSCGTIIAASCDTAFNAPTPTYTTNVLMGKRDEPLLTICARRIVEGAGAAGCTKPMLICLAMRDHSPDMLRAVVAAVEERNVWSSSTPAA